MESLISTLIVAIMVVAFITLTAKWLAKETTNKTLMVSLSPILHSLIDSIEGLVNVTNPHLNSNFTILSDIANSAVTAVEQMASKEDFTSEEKLQTALSFFNILIKETGIKSTDLDLKTAEILIENAVYRLNTEKMLNNQLF